MDNSKNEATSNNTEHNPFAQTFFHGTKADLKIGDYISPGFQCNYADKKLNHVYVSGTITAAIWGGNFWQQADLLVF